MSEFKFRAWIKKAKRMVPVKSLDFSEIEKEPVEVADCGNLNCGMCNDFHNWDEVEVMQYIGLHDSKEIEAYTGDVIRSGNKIYVIEERPGGFIAISPEERGCLIEIYESLSDLQNQAWFSQSFEVIGNIHKNPELLEKKL